jgi:hypothetical protein
MPAKTCIALALAVLFLALATGNPFLSRPKRANAAPVPTVELVSLRTGVPSGLVRDLPACPVPALQSLVAEVRFDADGAPQWILRDGRVVHADGLTVTGLPVRTAAAVR